MADNAAASLEDVRVEGGEGGGGAGAGGSVASPPRVVITPPAGSTPRGPRVVTPPRRAAPGAPLAPAGNAAPPPDAESRAKHKRRLQLVVGLILLLLLGGGIFVYWVSQLGPTAANRTGEAGQPPSSGSKASASSEGSGSSSATGGGDDEEDEDGTSTIGLPDLPDLPDWFPGGGDGPSPSPAPVLPFTPLRQAAEGSGVLFGSIHNGVRVWDTASEAEIAQYEQMLTDNFNLITPENACKPEIVFADGPDSADFSRCDRIIAWAAARGIKVRFHVGAWGDWNPDWMNALRPEEKRPAFIAYMSTMFAHFRGMDDVIYFDVVNEAVCDNNLGRRTCNDDPSYGRPEDMNLLRGGEGVSTWYPDIPDYMDLAFEIARSQLPNAMLLYNDYGHESTDDPADPGKFQRVFDWVQAARARGVPIDGIGFQLHVSTYHDDGIPGGMFSGWVEGVRTAIRRYAAIGVEVHITEIDIGCNFITVPCLPDTSEAVPVPGFPDLFGMSDQEAKKAVLYAKLLDICLTEPGCTAFQLWGSTDKYSWRTAGGLNDHDAHIFDKQYRPKASAYALAATFAAYKATLPP